MELYILFVKICMYISNLKRIILDSFWKLYKKQLPRNGHCLDMSFDFFCKLTFIGKLLFFIRPLMTREKKIYVKKNMQNVIKKTPKRNKKHIDALYNPTSSNLYFQLIKDALHQIVPNVIHIGKVQINDTTTINLHKTQITFFRDDVKYVREWIKKQDVLYLLTNDICSFCEYEQLQICRKIRKLLYVPNAGGSSELSEILSMYYMKIKFHASHFIPETKVEYLCESKICDYLMTIGKKNIGVSVTRAYCPFFNKLPETFVKSLLYKKLIGIVVAKKYVVNANKFDLSIIHIWCKTVDDAKIINQIYKKIICDDVYNLFKQIYIICSISTTNFIYTNLIL